MHRGVEVLVDDALRCDPQAQPEPLIPDPGEGVEDGQVRLAPFGDLAGVVEEDRVVLMPGFEHPGRPRLAPGEQPVGRGVGVAVRDELVEAGRDLVVAEAGGDRFPVLDGQLGRFLDVGDVQF